MDSIQKQKIFDYFDKNGVLIYFGRVHLQIDFNIKTDNSVKVSFPNNIVYDLEQSVLNVELSEVEGNKIALEYFETKGLKLIDLVEVDNYKIKDGKPYILVSETYLFPKISEKKRFKYIDFANETYRHSLAFYKSDGLKDLGDIKRIKGSLGLSECSIKSLGKLKRIDGGMWIAQETEPCDLEDLGELEHVGKDLNLKNTNVTRLNKLKHVGGNLVLRDLKVEDFGSLEYVGGNILLSEDYRNVFDFKNIEIKGKVKYFKN